MAEWLNGGNGYIHTIYGAHRHRHRRQRRRRLIFYSIDLLSPKFIIKVREDNQSCIAMAKNPKFIPRTKHIAIKYYHFWKHVITQANPDGLISLEYCSTHDQIADIFTKPVWDDIFFKLRKDLLGW